MEPKPVDGGGVKDTAPVPQTSLSWGMQALIESDWIRGQSDAVGLNTQRMILGHALRKIIGDDWNAYVYVHEGIEDQDSIEQLREEALLRLGWEIGLDELPDGIKEKLGPVKDVVEKSDWMDKDQFRTSKTKFVTARDEIIELMRENPDLDSARKYFDDNYGYGRQLPSAPVNRAS